MSIKCNDAKAAFADVFEFPADLRLPYLEAEYGGDKSLVTEVKQLLAAHEGAGSWLGGTVALPVAANSTAIPIVTQGQGSPPFDLYTLLQPPGEAGSIGRLDHYEILEAIGSGGFGMVLKARDTKLRRLVAVKLLAPHLAANGDARRRFAREAQAAAAVRDEHVVDIHEVQDGPAPYLVMEFVSGGTLADRLRAGQSLEVRELLRIGAQAARGLAAAHARGLVHRDVKPANILLDSERERARLTDFGLARSVDDDAERIRVTADGTIIGTPAYMSPEQARGKVVDARTDLFSLGAVLYQMGTGELPFRGTDIFSVLASLALDTPADPKLKNPLLPQALCNLILRLLAKDPTNRPNSAIAAAEELQRIADSLGPPEVPQSQSSIGGKKKSIRWKRIAAALLLAAIAATAAVIIRIKADGTIEIETDDPNLKVVIVKPKSVTTVRELAPPPRPVAQEKMPAIRSADAARRAAIQWVLDSGGWADVVIDGNGRSYRSGDQAPQEPCSITRLSLEGVLTLDDTLGEKLRALPDVTEGLILEGSSVTDAGLAGLAGCPGLQNITSITLGRTAVTGEGLKHLEAFPKLTRLLLWATPVTAADLAVLRRLKIEHLNLGGCPNVGDDAIDHIAATGITQLFLTKTGVTDAGVKKLRPMTRLWELNVTGPNITDESVATLCGFTDMKRLVLDGSGITDEGVIRLTAALPRLEWFHLRDTGVTDASIEALANSPELMSVFLNSTQVSDAGLEKLKDKKIKWKCLSLEGNDRRITDAGLSHLVGAASLLNLNVKGTGVTFGGLTDLSDRLPRCRIDWTGGVLERR